MKANDNQKTVQFLLVEDDDAHAKIFFRCFYRGQTGNYVERVRDGEEALQYLRREGRYVNAIRPDVVLMDLKLPKISGLDVLQVIREDQALKGTVVVILTSSESDVDKDRAVELNANGYLVKPTDPISFKSLIGELSVYWGEQHTAILPLFERKGGHDAIH